MPPIVLKQKLKILEFRVVGPPVAKGSTRAFLTKSGRPIITSTSRNLKSWETTIRSAAAQAATTQQWTVPTRDTPIGVSVSLVLPRPKSLPRKQTRHVKKPDLDKLIRAALDALTGIGYEDDSQVMMLDAYKNYAEPGDMPGMLVCVVTDP